MCSIRRSLPLLLTRAITLASPATTAKNSTTAPMNARWPHWSSLRSGRPKAGPWATHAVGSAQAPMTPHGIPSATNPPKTPLRSALAPVLVVTHGRAYVFHGTKGSALSKGPVPTPMSAPPVTVGPTKCGTAPRPLRTHFLRGPPSRGSEWDRSLADRLVIYEYWVLVYIIMFPLGAV